mgnify:CR=1 FL=1|jgi:hypothetical protein
MYSGQYTTSKSPFNSWDTPASNQCALHPSLVQPKTEPGQPQQNQTAEEQTQKGEVKQYRSTFIAHIPHLNK